MKSLPGKVTFELRPEWWEGYILQQSKEIMIQKEGKNSAKALGKKKCWAQIIGIMINWQSKKW